MHHLTAASTISVLRHTLLPGDVFCDRRPHRLHTILGSCVAVCLWDRRLRFGGMNHFILPECPAGTQPSGRFGDVATPWLVEGMLEFGSHKRDIQAKLFGGASVLGTVNGSEMAIGRRNIEVAIADLRHYRIPVVASRLAGHHGVTIVQCTACGDVWVRPMGGASAAAVRVQEVPWLSGALDSALIDADDAGALATVQARTQTLAAGGHTCMVCRAVPKMRRWI